MDMVNRRLIEAMFAKFDQDHSGCITLEEIQEGFKVFDTDGEELLFINFMYSPVEPK